MRGSLSRWLSSRLGKAATEPALEKARPPPVAPPPAPEAPDAAPPTLADHAALRRIGTFRVEIGPERDPERVRDAASRMLRTEPVTFMSEQAWFGKDGPTPLACLPP